MTAGYIQPPTSIFPLLSKASLQDCDSTVAVSLNFKNLITPAADECPQYWETSVTTARQWRAGIVLVFLICMISAGSILSTLKSVEAAWQLAGSSREKYLHVGAPVVAIVGREPMGAACQEAQDEQEDAQDRWN